MAVILNSYKIGWKTQYNWIFWIQRKRRIWINSSRWKTVIIILQSWYEATVPKFLMKSLSIKKYFFISTCSRLSMRLPKNNPQNMFEAVFVTKWIHQIKFKKCYLNEFLLEQDFYSKTVSIKCYSEKNIKLIHLKSG